MYRYSIIIAKHYYNYIIRLPMRNTKAKTYFKLTIVALLLVSFQIAQAETETVQPISTATNVPSVEATTNVAPVTPRLTPRKDALEVRKEIRAGAQIEKKEIKRIASSTKRMILNNRDGELKEAQGQIRAIRASTTEALRSIRASTTSALKINREELLKDIEAKREALKKQFEVKFEIKNGKKIEKKTEKKERLEKKAEEKVKKTLENIYTRLSNRLAELVKIETKITERINVLKAKGVNTTTSSTLLISAHTALTKAQIDVEATKSIAIEQTATSTSKEILKSLVQSAEVSIKTTADAYKKVAESLRIEAKTSGSNTATSTSSSTVSVTQ